MLLHMIEMVHLRWVNRQPNSLYVVLIKGIIIIIIVYAIFSIHTQYNDENGKLIWMCNKNYLHVQNIWL